MQREPPRTEEGWYVLHDLRSIDWDAWRSAPERDRERALADGVDYLRTHEAVEDAEEGQSAVYTVLGADADLMILHLRPTMADLDAAERRFEQSEFARFTERATSYVSVTEASGYTENSREYFEGDVDEDSGLARYIRARLHPEVPDDEFVCFYPMSKRRQPDQNWYDLPFEERANHIERHGDIGREYGGKVEQMIAGSTGLDDWEWGITLWSDDVTHIKDLLTRMRFDPSSSKFAEFGPFYIGRRFPPADLPAVMAGDHVPTGGSSADPTAARAQATDGRGAGADAGGEGGAHPGSSGEGDHPHTDAGDGRTDGPGDERERSVAGENDSGSGGRPDVSGDFEVIDDAAQRLERLGLRGGEDYDAGDFALLYTADADAAEIADDVSELAGNFDHYDRHVHTGVRANAGETVVVSIWTAREAAETAAGFLGDLPGIDRRLGGPLAETADDGTTAGTDEAGPETAATDDADAASIRDQLEAEGVYAGQPHGEDVYALVLYSEVDAGTLADRVGDLREGFDRYDTHVETDVYEALEGDLTAVVSLWETADAADTAADHLTGLPGVVGRPDEGDGFETMGMFYTVESEHREAFRDTFATVGERLAEMGGHRETSLLVNHEDPDDMFITSRWDAREDALAFFRSDEFAETVDWGRDVLADRPRHVFLA